MVRYFELNESYSYNSAQCDKPILFPYLCKWLIEHYGDIAATGNTLEGPCQNETEMQKQNCFKILVSTKQQKAKISIFWEPKMTHVLYLLEYDIQHEHY